MNDQSTGKRFHEIEGAGVNIYRLFTPEADAPGSIFEETIRRRDAKDAENRQQTTSKTKNRPIHEDFSLRSLATSASLH